MNTVNHQHVDDQVWTNLAVTRMGRKVDELLLGNDKVGEDNHEAETCRFPRVTASNVPPPLRNQESNDDNRDTVHDIDLDEMTRPPSERVAS